MRQMSEEREILYRLRQRQEDGTDKIVGWEWHKFVPQFETPCGIIPDNYTILHGKRHKYNKGYYKKYADLEDAKFSNITVKYNKVDENAWIDHDTKDQYTGIDVDGVKLFERDQVSGLDWYGHEVNNGLIIFEHLRWNVLDFDVKFLTNTKGACFCLSCFIPNSSNKKSYIKITGIQGVKDDNR